MKKRDILGRFLLSLLCGAALAIGNLFCLITAFDIPVDTELLILLCISSSLLFSAAFIFKRAWIGVSLVVCFIIWLTLYNWPSVVNSYILTVEIIAEQFIASYTQLSQLTIIAAAPTGTMATAFMALIGAILTLITTATVSRRYSLVPLATISILLLSVCLLILDFVPDVWAFVLLLGVYSLLALTQSRRRKSSNGQYLFTLVLALPVMLFMIIIVNVVQPETYIRSDWLLDVRDEFKAISENNSLFKRDEVTGKLEFISPFVQDTLGIVSWNNDISKTDLSKIGPQGQTGIPVMSVYSDNDTTYYLRGNSLAVYEDNNWLALEESDYSGVPITSGLWVTDAPTHDRIKIRTDSRSSIIYLPYSPTSLPEYSEFYYDSHILNTENIIEYTVPLANNASSAEISAEYEEFVHQVYTQVPDKTREALSEITEQLSEKALIEYDESIADMVAEYVRESAAYDLNTSKMPNNEDFVHWFLENSETGYCVHFASAATILLRCMDIPARYVSGYMVSTDGNGWNTVTQDNAHAWVEFYIDGYGWKMIDPTPASASGESETIQTIPEGTNTEVNQQGVDDGADESDTAEITDHEGENGFRIPVLVWFLLAVLLILVLWPLVLRRLRCRLLKQGSTNERAIKHYHQILLLSKLSKKPVSTDVEELAMKAGFSQHRLTADELAVIIDEYRQLCIYVRKDKNPFRYVLYHFVLALPKA